MEATNNTDKTVIFLHIPKTAGSTLHTILKKQYPPQTLVHLRGNPHIQPAIAEFKQQPDAQKTQIKLLTGHFEYGIHQYLPQPATYFTLIRNPIERVVSNYYFILRSPSHPRYQEMTQNKTSLITFVTDILTDNNQTRMIAGEWMDNTQPCTEETLTKAKQHIKTHFSLVGLTDQFDATLLLLQRTLEWSQLPIYGNRNVTQNRPSRKALTMDTIAAIQETQSYDVKLYAHTEKLLHKKMRQYGLPFTIQRMTHKLHQRTHPHLSRVQRFSIREFIRQRTKLP